MFFKSKLNSQIALAIKDAFRNKKRSNFTTKFKL